MNQRNALSSGLGPQPLQGYGSESGENPAFPLEVYQTRLLDLTSKHGDIELCPARPGYIPCFGGGVWVIESRSGTQTSPPTFSAGSNLTRDNFIAPTSTVPSNTDTNNANPPSQSNNLGPPVVAFQVGKATNATVYLNITAAAVGTNGYSCMARLVVSVMWVASGE